MGERGAPRRAGASQIKKFTVLPAVRYPDSGELTPTAKLKHRPIHAKYAEQIAQLYAE